MPKKIYRFLIILGISAAALSVPLFWFGAPLFSNFFSVGEAAGELEVIFLDVGQGDASLIKTPFGQNILIDGGPKQVVIKKLAEELPWWDRTIDLMVLSHPHDDHVAGLVPVFDHYVVKQVLYSGVLHSAPAYLEWLGVIRDKNIPLTIVDRPQTIVLGDACLFVLLHPRRDFLNKSVSSLNNTSLVAELNCAGRKVLFMGDAEHEVEKELLAAGVLAEVDIVKIGHHGSETSSGQEFLEAINPGIAVLSLGKNNKFGHPSFRVLKRLERLDIRIFRTDLSGTIRF